MKALSRILLVLDKHGDHTIALDWAASLGRENQGRLDVLKVIEGLPRELRGMLAIWRPLFLDQPEEPMIREATERLEESVRALRERGIQGNIKVLAAATYREIVSELLQDEYDLIVLSANRKGNRRERLFRGGVISRLLGGSIVETVLRRAHCPVLIVPSEYLAKQAGDSPQLGAEKMIT